MDINIPLVMNAVLNQYALPLGGVHGVAHWARVLENGLRLAEESRASIGIVPTFVLAEWGIDLNEERA